MASQTYINLPEELFETSGSSTFSGLFDLPELKAGPDTLRFGAPLPFSVTIMNTGDGSLLVSGEVSGNAVIDCARCLEPFDLPLFGEVEGWVFLADPKDDLPEDMDEDEYVVMDERHGVDIAAFLMAALVLDVPLVPLHDEGCLGLCPACGKNLNAGPCGCSPEPDEDFERAANPFSALKDFKFDE